MWVSVCFRNLYSQVVDFIFNGGGFDACHLIDQFNHWVVYNPGRNLWEFLGYDREFIRVNPGADLNSFITSPIGNLDIINNPTLNLGDNITVRGIYIISNDLPSNEILSNLLGRLGFSNIISDRLDPSSLPVIYTALFSLASLVTIIGIIVSIILCFTNKVPLSLYKIYRNKQGERTVFLIYYD